MPKKRETCPDCRGYGYLHVLGRMQECQDGVVACSCPAGTRFLKAWRRELALLSPPTKLQTSEVDTQRNRDNYVAKEVQPHKDNSSSFRTHVQQFNTPRRCPHEDNYPCESTHYQTEQEEWDE